MLRTIDRLLKKWWFGEAFLIACAGAVVFAAMLLTPSPEVVSLFGWDIPVVCQFRTATGMNCPGCGMTRSFAFMAHLQPVQAFQANFMGPALFAFIAGQLPYRGYLIWRGEPEK